MPPRRRKGKENRSNRASKSSSTLSSEPNEYWLDQITRKHLMVACSMLSFAIYINTLTADFAYDDSRTVKLNRDTLGETPFFSLFVHDFWGNDLNNTNSHRSWRPLTIIGFRMDYSLVGQTPWWYHFVNIIMNALVSSTFASILWDEAQEAGCFVKHMHVRAGVISGALVFACHPIHTEAVANITSRSEIYCALLCLLTVRYHQKCMIHNYILPVPLLFLPILAAFCKELGITITLICAGRDIAMNFLAPSQLIPKKQQHLHRQRNSICRVVLLAICAIGYLLLRLWVCAGQFEMKPDFDFNPIHFAPQPAKFLTACWVQVRYMWLLICPLRLACDYSFNSIPIVEDTTDIRIFGILILVLFLLGWTLIGFKRALTSIDIRMLEALAWLVFPQLPASHIVPIGTVLAERLLYIPSIGYCTAFAILTEKMLSKVDSSKNLKIKKSKRIPTIFLVFITLTVVCFSVRTVDRNFDWANDDTLFKNDVTIQPNSVQLLKLTGEAYAFKDDNWEKALELIMRAKELLPTARTLAIGSRIYANKKNKNRDFEQANKWADEALSFNESKANMAYAYYAKGYVLYEQQKFKDAIPYLELATLSGGQKYENCFLGNSYCQVKPPQFENAIPYLRKCVKLWELEDRSSDKLFYPYFTYGQALFLTGKFKKAEVQYQKALKVKPKHVSPNTLKVIDADIKAIRKKKKKK